MAVKKIQESPKITDQILFEITTTDDNGLLSNPYRVNRLVIYHLERDFLKNSNFSAFEDQITEQKLVDSLNTAKQLALSDPTEINLANYIKIQQEFDSNAQTKLFYYKHAEVVEIIGSDNFPAWLESDLGNARLENVGTGMFEFLWTPTGAREGDYFVCWEWEPEPAGTSLAKYTSFVLIGDTQLTTSIPTHFTPTNKYETLMERYTPEMFKQKMGNGDLTPEVIQEFNKAIAQGFTSIENLSNQMVDLRDSNSTHESFLHVLANNVGIRLRTTDATLWRRQIKRAIPLYKKKGTYGGLQEALDQAAVRLDKVTHLWQVVSLYTWQESFVVEDDVQEFNLNKVLITPLDEDNFEVYFRYADDSDWTVKTSGDVTLDTVDGITTLTPNDALSIGDEIKILYQYKTIPNIDEQNNETYLRSLPLADQRDTRDQKYPLKNWNVRLIEEDDLMFSVLIPNRHPFYDDVVFGHVRTEFPYSENIFNMEEYNGSIRESTDPCDIDRQFIDECSSCRSGYFNLDVEISQLSNIRIQETLEIVQDYVPFHARLFNMNFGGGISDFIQPPVEDIGCLIRCLMDDSVVMGQYTFNRSMLPGEQALRTDLADMVPAISNLSCTLYNEDIILFSPVASFNKLNISTNNVLEILSPYTEYYIENPDGHHANIIGPTDGFDPSPFTFNLSNDLLDTTADLYQDNVFKFRDDRDVSFFSEYEIKTYWDIDHTSGYSGGVWKVLVDSYGTFEIESVTPDNYLILKDPTDLLPSVSESDLTYTVLNDLDENVVSGTGILTVIDRGKVDLSPTDATIYKIGYYLVYDGNQYEIIAHNPDNTSEFYIADYTDGDVGGASVKIYQRLLNRKQGELSYKGLILDAGIDLESALEIQNGQNPPVTPLDNGKLKQNYLILINSEYYLISDIDANMVTLVGPHQDWEIGGTSGMATVYRFDKKDLSIQTRTENPKVPGYDFISIDRDSPDMIKETIETIVPLLAQKSLNNNSNIDEIIKSNESISFNIEYADGNTEQGAI